MSRLFDPSAVRLRALDELAGLDSPVHRLDARAKTAAAFVLIVTTVSFSKYDAVSPVTLALPLALCIGLGGLPTRVVAQRVAAAVPFALLVGAFNPLVDRAPVTVLPGVTLAAGWLSFAAVMVKSLLTVTVAALLIATTSFPAICDALRRFGLPAIFVTQLLLLYRYLFVLVGQASRMLRARQARGAGPGRPTLHETARLLGALFLRSIDRAERIHCAMLARGYTGELPSHGRSALRVADALAFAAVLLFCLAARFVPLPWLAGTLTRGALP